MMGAVGTKLLKDMSFPAMRSILYTYKIGADNTRSYSGDNGPLVFTSPPECTYKVHLPGTR